MTTHHRGSARRVTPERQRLVLLDRRRRQPKVKVAALVLEVRLDRQRKPEIVYKEILRRRFAHVHAHAGAPALLKPSALFDVNLAGDHLPEVVLRRGLHLHRSNHPREHDLTDGRVEFQRKLVGWEELAEDLIAAGGHERAHDAEGDVPLAVRIAALHLEEAERDELVVGDVGRHRGIDGHRDLPHEPRHQREVEGRIAVGDARGRGGPVARELGGGEVEEGVRLGVRVGGVRGGRARGDGCSAAGARGASGDVPARRELIVRCW
mmetsp:Transcript_585/g.2760  ORF Transcript_585/g.2760 Transcript_585/m.2760 type:complete len:265 (-) Transcript_585:733-1527(-)